MRPFTSLIRQLLIVAGLGGLVSMMFLPSDPPLPVAHLVTAGTLMLIGIVAFVWQLMESRRAK